VLGRQRVGRRPLPDVVCGPGVAQGSAPAQPVAFPPSNERTNIVRRRPDDRVDLRVLGLVVGKAWKRR